MGIDSDLAIDELRTDFLCSICTDIVQTPVEINGCQHHFCDGCIRPWIQETNQKIISKACAEFLFDFCELILILYKGSCWLSSWPTSGWSGGVEQTSSILHESIGWSPVTMPILRLRFGDDVRGIGTAQNELPRKSGGVDGVHILSFETHEKRGRQPQK